MTMAKTPDKPVRTKTKSRFLGWSSHCYPLECGELVGLPDYEGPAIRDADLPPDPVILFIRKDHPDVLLRGRDKITNAASPKIMVRVVFEPNIPPWNLPKTIIRVLRNPYRYHSSNIYHLSPSDIREMGLERAIRTLDNPQPRKGVDRTSRMKQLERNLRDNGYDDLKPINIMLCRSHGYKDSLRQGHHRISACLECGICRLSAEFSAAGAAPWSHWTKKKRRTALWLLLAVATTAVALAIAYVFSVALPIIPKDMNTCGLPEITAIGETSRQQKPEELSGIVCIGKNTYLTACDNGTGIWKLEIMHDPDSGRINSCRVIGNLPIAGDCEAIAWDKNTGTILMADEKTQTISKIHPQTGEVLGHLEIPQSLKKHRSNRGMESLSISPDGHFLWTANEEALKTDGGLSTNERGTVVRLVRFVKNQDGAWQFDSEWAYMTDSIDGMPTKRNRSGVSDLCAIDNRTLLVLERELSLKGVTPSYRSRIYAVRPTGTDKFNPRKPIAKKLLFGADTGSANYEGICLGPQLNDGDKTLLMISDGNSSDDERLYSLRLKIPSKNPPLLPTIP